MDMDLTEFRIAGVVGIMLVGLLTTVGAFVASFAVAGLARARLAMAKRVSAIQTGTAGETRASFGSRRGVAQAALAGAADHALLARQAWWRLRC
jgi:hypothetical protein